MLRRGFLPSIMRYCDFGEARIMFFNAYVHIYATKRSIGVTVKASMPGHVFWGYGVVVLSYIIESRSRA